MIRRKVFDAHQNLEGMSFYDLCAGSGAMGIEAASRGAKRVVFQEPHYQSLGILKRNVALAQEKLDNLEIECQLICNKNKVQGYLTHFKKEYLEVSPEEQSSVILFLDPPYKEKKIYEFFLKNVIQEDWFQGSVWIESDDKKGLAPSWWEKQGVNSQKTYTHGDSFLLII